MIRRLIKNLRDKPKSSRDSVAFVAAALFTGMVAFFWTLGPADSNRTEISQTTGETQVANPAFSQFFDGIKDQINSAKESFGQLEELAEETPAIEGSDAILSSEIEEKPVMPESKENEREVKIMPIKSSSSIATSSQN